MKSSHLTPRPSWPIIAYWLLSIAQYSFRYIFRVSDTHTSGFGYTDTPWYLSGIKHVITASFCCYCLGCMLRDRRSQASPLRALNWIYFLSFVVGVCILGIKLV